MTVDNEKQGMKILVVDDEVEMTNLLADQLRDLGYSVDIAISGNEALELARTAPPDLVIADLRMEGSDGFEVLTGIHQIDPLLPVLIMTAFGSIDTAVEAIKRGAYHYVTKPFKMRELAVFVKRALQERRLKEENRDLKQLIVERTRLNSIVGRSQSMQEVYNLIERVAPSDVSVLIQGESGTGKELIAQTIHLLSPRKNRPFVALNCTALPEPLLESELFGHVRGAFTGASAHRKGQFVEADGGTLFLDEIGDMPLSLQGKLLRVLEDGVVRAVGSDSVRNVDVRVVAATHQNLEDRIAEAHFRDDLFYRLNVVPIHVPPLRERVEDLPHLVEQLLDQALKSAPTSPVRRFSKKAMAAMAEYHWPGNVRELKNAIQRLVLVCGNEVVEFEDFERHFATKTSREPFSVFSSDQLVPLRNMEDEYIAHVIRQCKGNKTKAAEILEIDPSTIHRRQKGP